MQNKKIIIFFIAFFFLTTMFSFNTVNAAPGDVTLTNWDDVASGLDSGTSNYIEFFNAGTVDRFETSTDHDLSPANSFKIVTGQPGGEGYWNLTEPFTSIEEISFSFYLTGPAQEKEIRMEFWNGTDRVIWIEFNFMEDAANRHSFSWYDVSTGWHEILDSALLFEKRAYAVISHNGTNQFNIQILNETFVEIANEDYAGSHASTYVTFDRIYVDGAVDNTPFLNYVYIDDLAINTLGDGQVGGGDDEFENLILESPPCGVIGTMPMMRYFEWFGKITDTIHDSPYCIPFYCWDSVPCPYIEMKQENKVLDSTIYYVDLFVSSMQESAISGSLAHYSCRVNNNPFTFMGFTHKTIDGVNGLIMRFGGSAVLTNQTPLFCFYSSQSYNDPGYGNEIHWIPAVMSTPCNWDSRKHDVSADYIDGQLDGVPFNNPGRELSDDQYYFTGRDVSPYVQYWYSGGITEYEPFEEPPTIPETANYTAKYGGSFIEFYENTVPCRYGVGSYPVIIYHLNDSMLGLYRTYKYEVVNSATENVEMTGSIIFPDNINDKYVILTHNYNAFSSIGQYYIRLWNLTTNHVLDQVVEESQTSIVVCEKSIIDIDIPIDADNVPSVDKAIKSLPVYIKVIFALFIIIIITMSPYVITVMISKTNINVEIPSLLYVAFFFTGIITCIALGLLEIYVFFIVLIGLIITFTILWLQGSKIGGED